MTDVRELLERATGDPIEIDVDADLQRGRNALRRRRARLSAGAVGIVVAGVAGAVALPQILPGSPIVNDSGAGPGAATSKVRDEPKSDSVERYLATQQAFVTCARNNGVPDMPDPDELGRIAMKVRAMKEGQVARRMMAACYPIIEGIDVPPELQALRDDRLASKLTPEEKKIEADYAACMQANGVPEYPDPEANGLPSTPDWDRPHSTVVPPKALGQATEECFAIRGGGEISEAADPTHPEFYDLTVPPPIGWHVVDHNPSGVMIAKDGDTGSFNFGSFRGKLMILLEDKAWPMNHGTKIDFNGRTFYDNQADGESATLSVQVESGDWLQVQYPLEVALDRDALIRFLDGVVVKPGAIGAKG